jgi:hypothetical protein
LELFEFDFPIEISIKYEESPPQIIELYA